MKVKLTGNARVTAGGVKHVQGDIFEIPDAEFIPYLMTVIFPEVATFEEKPLPKITKKRRAKEDADSPANSDSERTTQS